MTRVPYDAHLCAQDPTAWENGFNAARTSITNHLTPAGAQHIYETIRDSTDTGVDWAWWEGWMLGVYGLVALEQTQAKEPAA